jgi:hypothetical protein
MRWLYAASNAALFIPGSRAVTKSPSVGTPCGRPPLAAFHRSDQRLRTVHKRLLDRHDHHCRGLLAVDGEAVPKVRIRADPSASVHAVGLVDTGDKEDQPNARVLNKISETINQIVAATVGNEQCPTVIRNLHEPRPITLRRTVEAFSASGGENQKWRGGNKRAANCVNMVKPFFEDSFPSGLRNAPLDCRCWLRSCLRDQS